MDLTTCLRVTVTVVAMATAVQSLPSRICKRAAMTNSTSCPLNSTMTMPEETMFNHLYPGLFMNEDTVLNTTLFDDAFKVKNFRKVKKVGNQACGKNGKCYKSPNRQKREAGDCCESETNVLELITVEKDNLEYSVVHLPSSAQFLTENTCSSEDSACTVGKCQSLLGLHWVLVSDPNVAYYPPVRFVMVAFKMGCSCMP